MISVTVIFRTPEVMDTSYVRLWPPESPIVNRPRKSPEGVMSTGTLRPVAVL